jgi:uncharacterized membrane protein YoaK (UPF0700 family)
VRGLLRRYGTKLSVILLVEAVALVTAAFIGAPLAPPVLAFGMGLQNAAVTRFTGASLNTVFLTGDLQKLVLGLAARWAGGVPLPQGVWVAGWIWSGYLGGALLGGAAFEVMQRPLVLAPILLPLALLGSQRRPAGDTRT